MFQCYHYLKSKILSFHAIQLIHLEKHHCNIILTDTERIQMNLTQK